MSSNIYTELKVAGATLRAAGRTDDARAMTKRVYACTDIPMARAVMREYMRPFPTNSRIELGPKALGRLLRAIAELPPEEKSA